MTKPHLAYYRLALAKKKRRLARRIAGLTLAAAALASASAIRVIGIDMTEGQLFSSFGLEWALLAVALIAGFLLASR